MRERLNPTIIRRVEAVFTVWSYLLSAEAPSSEKAEVWGSSSELWDRHFLNSPTITLPTLSLLYPPLQLITYKTYHLLLLLYFLSLLSSLAAALEF